MFRATYPQQEDLREPVDEVKLATARSAGELARDRRRPSGAVAPHEQILA